ncbi:helix-turn-helix domain-containing protein [Plantactinospora solaniradicis]|uniref:Helix-turn-helix domain-containing protein n=1 Tax=Plantactinospora solaniradicis TaxID=1723736 RepID=A0ABW1K1C6_9ACTN
MSDEFNARMVTLARESEGLTQSALAHLAGISQGHVSKIENGFEEPHDDVLEQLAKACDVPIEFFYQKEEVLGEGVVDFYHKKRLTLPVKPLKKANALANVRRLEAVRLLRTLEFDSVAPFPFCSPDESWTPEVAAQFVRATWRMPPGPLPNLIALIEATGIPVFITNLGHEKLSAISMPGVAGRHVIVLNGMLPASARRFALAHELGHLVMHNGSASDDMERDADAFASALLMPASDIRRELQGLRFRELGALKARWHVSLAALVKRASDLGLITERQYRTSFIQLSKLPGGRKNEPGEFEMEEPRLMRYLIEHYQRDLQYSREQVAKLMVLHEHKLAEIYFGEASPKLRVMEPKRHLHSVPMPPANAKLW